MIGLKDLDPNQMTSDTAMQAAADAVRLVRNGNASIEELLEAVIVLSVIVVTAVKTIEAISALNLKKKSTNIMDVDGHEVSDNRTIN